MRHIKKSDLHGFISEEWLHEASVALDELKALTPDKRGEYIRNNAEIWSRLKSILAKLSHEKCWYSEVRMAPSELEIDHFRPKNHVSQSTIPHKGYWWLAFEWENYRLAYSLINKRRRDPREEDIQGKGCYFPLVDESARVPDTAPCSTAAERPMLIDPFVASDVMLLDYAVESGKVVEMYLETGDTIRHHRAKRSIDLYHLNEGTLIRDRQELQVLIAHLSHQVEELCRRREVNGLLDQKQEQEYDGLVDRLGDIINSTSRFSSFARACLRQKGDLGWNTVLLSLA